MDVPAIGHEASTRIPYLRGVFLVSPIFPRGTRSWVIAHPFIRCIERERERDRGRKFLRNVRFGPASQQNRSSSHAIGRNTLPIKEPFLYDLKYKGVVFLSMPGMRSLLRNPSTTQSHDDAHRESSDRTDRRADVVRTGKYQHYHITIHTIHTIQTIQHVRCYSIACFFEVLDDLTLVEVRALLSSVALREQSRRKTRLGLTGGCWFRLLLRYVAGFLVVPTPVLGTIKHVLHSPYRKSVQA